MNNELRDMKNLKPKSNETLDQYIFRIGQSKKELKISWQDMSQLVLENYNKQLSKDYIRHMIYSIDKLRQTKQIENNEYVKVLVMNDLHIPYQRDDVFTEIEKYKDVDYIILGGDFLDCISCSSWGSFEHPSVDEELVLAHEFLCKVNEIVDINKTKIIAIRGNHEYRYTRDIMKMQERELQKMLNPNLLSMLEKGFTIYDKNKEITYKGIENFQYINDWYARLFDNLIVAHPTDFSNVEGSMCLKVADYFLNQDIVEKEDIIIFGHTHKHSSIKVNRRQGVYVIENSCLCKEQEYASSGKLKFTPQNYGYTYLKFKDGEKINLNDVKVVYLD